MSRVTVLKQLIAFRKETFFTLHGRWCSLVFCDVKLLNKKLSVHWILRLACFCGEGNKWNNTVKWNVFQQLKHLGDLGCLIKGGYTWSEEFKKRIKTFGPGFRLVYDLWGSRLSRIGNNLMGIIIIIIITISIQSLGEKNELAKNKT